MSRRKRRNRAENQQQTAKSTRKYYIPLEEWKKFERYKHASSALNEIIDELRTNWYSHLDWLCHELTYTHSEFSDLTDNVESLCEIINTIRYRRTDVDVKSYTPSQNINQVKVHKKGKKIKIAEIIIEDVGDEI